MSPSPNIGGRIISFGTAIQSLLLAWVCSLLGHLRLEGSFYRGLIPHPFFLLFRCLVTPYPDS